MSALPEPTRLSKEESKQRTSNSGYMHALTANIGVNSSVKLSGGGEQEVGPGESKKAQGNNTRVSGEGKKIPGSHNMKKNGNGPTESDNPRKKSQKGNRSGSQGQYKKNYYSSNGNAKSQRYVPPRIYHSEGVAAGGYGTDKRQFKTNPGGPTMWNHAGAAPPSPQQSYYALPHHHHPHHKYGPDHPPLQVHSHGNGGKKKSNKGHSEFVIELDSTDDETCKVAGMNAYALQHATYECMDSNLEYHLQYIYYCHGLILMEHAKKTAEYQEEARRRAVEDWLMTRTEEERELYLSNHRGGAVTSGAVVSKDASTTTSSSPSQGEQGTGSPVTAPVGRE